MADPYNSCVVRGVHRTSVGQLCCEGGWGRWDIHRTAVL